MVLSLIQQFGPASRKEIDTLLLDKLSDILTEGQKYNKMRNLLQEMRNDGSIRPLGGRGQSSWTLDDK